MSETWTDFSLSYYDVPAKAENNLLNFRLTWLFYMFLFRQNTVKFVRISKIGNMTHFSFRHAKFTLRGCVPFSHCCVLTELLSLKGLVTNQDMFR